MEGGLVYGGSWVLVEWLLRGVMDARMRALLVCLFACLYEEAFIMV